MAPNPTQLTPISVRPKEAARLLGISLSYLYLLKNAGKIPFRRVGKAAASIDYEALVAYRDSLPMIELDMKPTGPLLPLDQQQLAIERARESDEPPRRGHPRRPRRPRPEPPAAPEPAADMMRPTTPLLPLDQQELAAGPAASRSDESPPAPESIGWERE